VLCGLDVVAEHRRAGAEPGARLPELLQAVSIITDLAAWDLAGHLPLPLGVLGHEGSTVIVGLNGLRLLRTGAWRKAITPGAR
jgi:hypothetical protein